MIAAASLMIDYVMTVAVSVASGVAAVTSAFPSLYPLPADHLAGRRGRSGRAGQPAWAPGIGQDIRASHVRLHPPVRRPGGRGHHPLADGRSPSPAACRR